MSEELLTGINQKLALIHVELASLVQLLSNGAVAPAGGMKQDFDDEFQQSVDSTPLPPGASSTAGIEVDKEHYPWDERIHSSNKKKTAKGIWTKRKNVEPTAFDAVINELNGKGFGPNYQAQAAAPTGGPTVGAGGPPGVAPSVGAGGPPGVAPAENADKTSAMEHIAILTDEFGVDYSLILGAITVAFEVDSFDKLTVEQYPHAKNLFTHWVDDVRICDEESEQIIELGADQGKAGITQVLTNNGISKLAELTYDKVAGVKSSLSDYRVQWENYVNGQQ